MKYIKQLTVILFISFLGENLSRVIPVTVPASVYGILILFIALASGILPLEKIEKTADLLLAVMPVLFVPAGVGLMTVWDKMADNLFAIIIITAVSTAAVMAVTGLISQAAIKRKKKRNEEKNDK